MSADLASFLRARLDETERLAVATTYTDLADPWEAPRYAACYPEGAQEADEDDRRHIEHHHPARVLADVAAKRAILDRYGNALLLERGTSRPAGQTAPELERVLRLLALPYVGHPDYHESWRP